MRISEAWNGAWRRIADTKVSAFFLQSIRAMGAGKRRTAPLPSVLTSYGGREMVLPKPTPANLRRFAETPVARKAINSIKDRVACMQWQVRPKNGRKIEEVADGATRIQIITDNLDAPNSDDSFRSLAEQVLEDVIVGGFGAIEVQTTGDAARPLNLWPGGWRDHPAAQPVGRRTGLTPLRAGDGARGRGGEHRPERR